jgi:cyclohexyl-isocyanide hydratase
VLSRIPNATHCIYGKTAAPVRDLKGLQLTADATLADAPPPDVLHVPGGYGQEALMEDADVLGWIRQQASGVCSIFSVCTGRPNLRSRGLKGRRATTDWSTFHLLPFFGAIPVNERGVVDSAWVLAAGVTAGIENWRKSNDHSERRLPHHEMFQGAGSMTQPRFAGCHSHRGV